MQESILGMNDSFISCPFSLLDNMQYACKLCDVHIVEKLPLSGFLNFMSTFEIFTLSLFQM